MWGPGFLGSRWDTVPSLLPLLRPAPSASQWAFHKALQPDHSSWDPPSAKNLINKTSYPRLRTHFGMGIHLQQWGLAQWGAGQGALRALDPCLLPSPSSVLWRGQGVCQPPGGLRRGGGEWPWPSLTLISGVGWDGGGLGSPPHPLPALGCRAPPQPSPCLPAAPRADLPPSTHGLSSRAAAPPILRLQAAPHHSDPQIPTLWHRQQAPASRSPCPPRG